MEELQSLRNESIVSLRSLHHMLDKVDKFLKTNYTYITDDLFRKIDQLGLKVDLEDSKAVIFVRDNVALLVVDNFPDKSVIGVEMGILENNHFDNNTFRFVSDEYYKDFAMTNDTLVLFPSYVTDMKHRMSFIAYKDSFYLGNRFGQTFIINSQKREGNKEKLMLIEERMVIPEAVIEDSEILVENNVSMVNVNNSMDKINAMLEMKERNIPGEVLQELDQLGLKTNLEGSRSVVVVRDNVALLIADADLDNPIRGVRITSTRNDTFKHDCFDFITDEDYTEYLVANDSDTIVSLPPSLIKNPHRMSFVVFRDDQAFQHDQFAVNSRILSINVENFTQFEEGEVISIYFRPIINHPGQNMKRVCAHWQFLEDGNGYWSEKGCNYVRNDSEMLDICQCDHLTHFAEVLINVRRFSKRNETILEIVSIIGCSLSLLGLLIVAITAAMFKTWRKNIRNKIWLQLCVAIFILNVCFLIITFVKFEQNIWCTLIGVTLHYSVLASFCWMLVAIVITFSDLVTVFQGNVSYRVLKSSVFAWGFPCLVIIILFSTDTSSYGIDMEQQFSTGAFCYPSGLNLYLTLHLPLTVILCLNWFLFILIMRSVFASKKIRVNSDPKSAVRSALVSSLLAFLFGLPWIFGFFAHNIVFAYLFAVTCTFQGFVSFVFIVIINMQTRELWLKKIKLHQRKPSSTVDTASFMLRRYTRPPVLASNEDNINDIENLSDEQAAVFLNRSRNSGMDDSRTVVRPSIYYQ